MKLISFLLISFLLSATYLHAETFDVEFINIKPGIWIHRSYEIVGGYKTPSNGMIIENDFSVLLVDTAWNNEETQQIINFIKNKIRKPLKGCVITHFHQDRSGGLFTISQHKIPVYMLQMTADALNYTGPFISISIDKALILDEYKADFFYPGAAHSRDNVIVWLPYDRILFGGCLIKSRDSTFIGNTADADIKNWPIVLENLKVKYSEMKLIIPGHGESGDVELISHTQNLLERK